MLRYIAIGCLIASSSFAFAVAGPVVTLRDGSQQAEMELALDEVSVSGPDSASQLKKIPVQPSLTGLLDFATGYFLTTKEEPKLVFYLANRPHTDLTRRVLTNRLLVETDGTLPLSVLQKMDGVSNVEAVPGGNFYMISALHPGGVLALMDQVVTVKGVTSVTPELSHRQQKRSTIPNDTLFGKQWHLRNTVQNKGAVTGIDANVIDVWDKFKGTGIRLALVDDGLQYTHPDLAPNYLALYSHDFNRNSSDPMPNLSVDDHGSSCAGVAGARGGNGLGVSGVAPLVSLVGLRLIGDNTVDQQEADCFNYQLSNIEIKSNSWGPPDGDGYYAPGPLATAALKNAAETGRGGKGEIFCWAGGNGKLDGDNSNLDGYANSIYVIGVGACDDRGIQADYSESGANLIVSAPSSATGRPGIVTTDLTGTAGYNTGKTTGELSDANYTNDFGGTSSACPVISGVCALMLQANPNLGWRDVQEILLRTAKRVSSADKNWKANSAGFWTNIGYGGGLVDAKRAVALAQVWKNLPAMVTGTYAATSGLPASPPDNNATGVTIPITVAAGGTIDRIEHVVLEFSATHSYRGDLQVTLTSPTGIVSPLAPVNNDNGKSFDKWKFMTVADWGENPVGTWKVQVADRASGDTGKVTALKLYVYGTKGLAVNYNQETADTQLPVVVITSPSNNSTVSTGSLAIKGTAKDNVAVDVVNYSFNGGPWQTATGTTSWAVTVAPVTGTNTIQIRAADSSRNLSATQAVTVIKK